MYLKFNKDEITGAQLKAIAAILELDNVKDLEWFYNIHYEACRFEIECVIENTIDNTKSAEKFKKENEDDIIEWTDELYYSSDYQWDRLYEKAEDIVDLELDDDYDDDDDIDEEEI